MYSKSAAVQNSVAGADVAALTETCDRTEFADNLFADLQSYDMFCGQRENRHHGGVCLAVRKNLKAFRWSDFEVTSIEFSAAGLFVVLLLLSVFIVHLLILLIRFQN